jgi:hypothetical protein
MLTAQPRLQPAFTHLQHFVLTTIPSAPHLLSLLSYSIELFLLSGGINEQQRPTLKSSHHKRDSNLASHTCNTLFLPLYHLDHTYYHSCPILLNSFFSRVELMTTTPDAKMLTSQARLEPAFTHFQHFVLTTIPSPPHLFSLLSYSIELFLLSGAINEQQRPTLKSSHHKRDSNLASHTSNTLSLPLGHLDHTNSHYCLIRLFLKQLNTYPL